MKNNPSSKEKQKNQKTSQPDNTFQNDEYNQMLIAMEEEDVLMEEIENFIIQNQNAKNLDELIQNQYFLRLEKTKTQTQKAIQAWRNSIQTDIKKIEKLINQDLESDN